MSVPIRRQGDSLPGEPGKGIPSGPPEAENVPGDQSRPANESTPHRQEPPQEPSEAVGQADQDQDQDQWEKSVEQISDAVMEALNAMDLEGEPSTSFPRGGLVGPEEGIAGVAPVPGGAGWPRAASGLAQDPYSFFSWPTSLEGFWGPQFLSASLPSFPNFPNFPNPALFSNLLSATPAMNWPNIPTAAAAAAGGPAIPETMAGAPSGSRGIGIGFPSVPGAFPASNTAIAAAAGPPRAPPSLQEIARVFPRHVGSRVMLDESGTVIWRPAADIFETTDAIIVHVDLPGVPKNEINIDLRGADVVIWGEHKTPFEAASSRVRERNIGKFRKIVTLPLDQVSVDKIDAKAENGLLEVKIAKKPEAKGKRISIE